MGLSSQERVLPYTLCAFAGAGIMFNITLLIWHCVKFKAGKDIRYLKYAFGGLSIAYIFTGLAITLLILYSDLMSEDLCKIGGFLSLFASQESFWMLATSCLVYLLWIRARIPMDNDSTTSEYEVTNKWSVPIFILILIVKCIVLAIVSFLPMTNIAYFNTNNQYYYLCTPLRLPGEQGWPYSTLILTLDWVALLVALTNLILVNIHLKKTRKTMDITTRKEYLMKSRYSLHKDVIKVEFTMNVTFVFNNIFWTLILLLISINYFSGGRNISQDSIQWIIGFLVTLLIVLHPVVVCLLQFIVKTNWFCKRYFAQEETFNTKSPKSLESVQKLLGTSQTKDTNQYIVHWKDGKGHLISGTMKVFHPSANHKMRNEVRAVTKMANNTSPDHPNIVKYFWQEQKNKYAAMIYSQTGDMLSLESGLICKTHYAHGNLQQFLKSRIHQLTEVGIHKITLDIANGLDFIHEKGIVHNMLNSKCVYMASVSEKIGLRAVIGDFENSTEVITTLEQVRKREHLYAISYGQNLESTDTTCQFATDIRAFGVLVLEMLISLSEYNHIQTSKRSSKCSQLTENTDSAFQTMPHSPVVNYGQMTAKRHQNKQTHLKQKQQSNSHEHVPNTNKKHSKLCGCSNRVTEIRALTKESERKMVSGSPLSAKLPPSVIGAYCAHEVNLGRDIDIYEQELNLDSYLEVVEDIRDNQLDIDGMHMYDDPQNVIRIQRRELPPIPIQIEKVVADVVSASETVISHPPRQSVKESLHYENQLKPQVKPKLKPKPNLLASIQKSMIFTESGESDVDSLYVRSPDSASGANLNNPLSATDSDNSPDGILMISNASSSSTNKPNDLTSDDMYNASVGSFDTIYEDDESQDSVAQSLDSGLGKSQIKAEKYAMQTTVPQFKRKILGHAKPDSEAWKKKRLSGASFNDSILSGDSGVGSSHYCTSSEASRQIYAPPAGSRGTIYETRKKESEGDSYSILMDYIERSSQKIDRNTITNGATVQENDHSNCSEFLGYNPSDSHDIPRTKNDMCVKEENFDELYELLPDLIIRKKPCKGQHKHIPGMTCCRNFPRTSGLTNDTGNIRQENFSSEKVNKKLCKRDSSSISSKTYRHSNNNTIESVDIGKVLVDESTMTTDSLERHKNNEQQQSSYDYHGVQTDNESVVTEISCTSVLTVNSRSDDYNNLTYNNNHRITDKETPGKSKPPMCTTPRSGSARPNNVPKLGLTAVAFSRQMNSSVNSTPLSGSISGPSGSMQSLVTGRSSVMSGNSIGGQSVRSLPGGTNSINSSVLSLLQDSNLLVAGNNIDRTRHYRTHHHQKHPNRSNRGVLRQISSNSSHSSLNHSRQSPNVITNHPVVKQIVDMSSNPETVVVVLDTLKKKGHLGYTAAQLVPLLKDCWLQQHVPSTQDILGKLGQVLPTASV